MPQVSLTVGIAATVSAPTVSVLMTAYNRERYIGEAIESVLAQTYGDFELVVVDDCSKDGTVAVAERYAAADRRVQVVCNDRNLGDYPNRNRAASLARGKFLKYHDSDDVMYPHCLATMVRFLVESGADLALTRARAWEGGPVPMLLTPRMCFQREFLGSGFFNNGPANALFVTKYFRDFGCFPERGPHSDYEFWLRACRTAKVVLVPTDLYWYRIHPGQHLQGARAVNDSLPLFRQAWEALESPDCPLIREEQEQAKRNLAWLLLKSLARDVAAGKLDLAVRRHQSSGMTFRAWRGYFRRAARDRFAGVPRCDDGEFVVPAWVRPPKHDSLAACEVGPESDLGSHTDADPGVAREPEFRSGPIARDSSRWQSGPV